MAVLTFKLNNKKKTLSETMGISDKRFDEICREVFVAMIRTKTTPEAIVAVIEALKIEKVEEVALVSYVVGGKHAMEGAKSEAFSAIAGLLKR